MGGTPLPVVDDAPPFIMRDGAPDDACAEEEDEDDCAATGKEGMLPTLSSTSEAEMDEAATAAEDAADAAWLLVQVQ